MKFLNRNLPVFVVAAFVYISGQYFRGEWFPNFTWPFPCHLIHFGSLFYCDSPYATSLGWPLIAAGTALAIVAVILLFANDAGWRRWLRFSKWYVPIVVLVVALLFPIALPVGAELSRQGAALRLGQLYEIITLCIVLLSYFHARRAISQ